jgi:hypothetical protein
MNEALRGTVRGHAMVAADYVIFAVFGRRACSDCLVRPFAS